MRRIILLFIISQAMVIQKGHSQAKVLTFQDAVKIALENNVTLNTQKNQLELSQMQKSASISALAPNVSANGNAFQVNGNSFNNQQGRLVNGVRDAITGSINANMVLFNGFNLVNTVKQNTNQLDAQAYFVKRTGEDIINSVSAQYLQVLLDIELLRIAKENYEAQLKQYEQIAEQVKLGSRSPVDEYNQDAQAKNAELRALQAEISLINDKAILTQTLLLDPFDQFEVTKPGWDVEAIGVFEPALEELNTTALNNRGDYLRAVKNEEGQKYGMKARKAAMTPTLVAFGNIGSAYNNIHNIPDSLNRPFEDQFNQDNVYKSYGLQLSIPIFSGLQNRSSYVQQKVTYMNSQLIRKNAEVQVKTDVLRTYQNFHAIQKAYVVSVAQLSAADMAFKLETERYNLGVTNLIEYIQANRSFVQAQTDKAQAEFRLVFQKILLDYATGTLKVENIQ